VDAAFCQSHGKGRGPRGGAAEERVRGGDYHVRAALVFAGANQQIRPTYPIDPLLHIRLKLEVSYLDVKLPIFLFEYKVE
jgi:hypothetical protein